MPAISWEMHITRPQQKKINIDIKMKRDKTKNAKLRKTEKKGRQT